MLLGTGCATTPNPESVAGLANALVFRTEALPKDAPTVDNHLTLPEAIERALRQAPKLQIALADVRIKQAATRQARLLPNPVINLVFRFPRKGGSPVTEAGLTADLVAALQAPRRIRVADNELRTASARAASTALDVIADTEKCYHTVNALQQKVLLLEKVANHIMRLLEIAQYRLEVGEGTRLDVAALQARRAETAIDLRENRLKSHQEQLALARLLGQPSGGTDWQPSTPLPVATPAQTEADWLAAALNARPAIQADRWQLAALEDGRALARLAMLENTAVGLDAERESDWSLGPSLAVPLPVFDWGQAHRARARAQTIAARHRLTQTVRQTVQEIRQAHTAQTCLAAAAALAREQLTPLQQQRVELTRAVYETGQSDITPLLLAELDLQQALLRRINLELRAAIAAIQLRRASGGANAFFKPKATTHEQ